MNNRPFQIILTILIVVISTQTSRAGGSVSYNDIRGTIPADVRNHLEASFAIAEVGDATRLGRHFTHLGGARIGPYLFSATSKLNNGNYEVTIVTNVKFLNRQGNPTDAPENAERIQEDFLHYEVRSAGGGGQGQPQLPAKLSDAEKEQVVTVVRAVYNDISNTNLRISRDEFEKDETSGTIQRGYDQNGRLRKIELSVATGDHGGYHAEVYYDNNTLPAFVLWEDSYWSFDPKNPNRTIDNVAERRYYFSPQGQLARCLEKVFQGSGEADLLKNREKAKNQDFPADPHGAIAFFQSLKDLYQTRGVNLDPVLNDIWGAQNMMEGPDEEP